jgi:hypothetical protein
MIFSFFHNVTLKIIKSDYSTSEFSTSCGVSSVVSSFGNGGIGSISSL